MRTALSLLVKDQMDVEMIRKREKELVRQAFDGLENIQGSYSCDNVRNRLGILSFYIDNVHYNLVVKLLSDRFGIRSGRGCACAGTYGHFLLM
jgi:selenocysteine lyase/cysteine desulfurase